MILYVLKSALVLMLLYTCFFSLTSRETFHRLNRVLLVGTLVLSVIVPFVHMTVSHPLSVAQEIVHLRMDYNDATSSADAPVVAGAPVAIESVDVEPVAIESVAAGPAVTAPATAVSKPWWADVSWPMVVTTVYVLGVGAMLLLIIVQLVQLALYLRGGLRHTDEHGNTVILKAGNVAPFSLFRIIVMSVDDYERNRLGVLLHEQEHIRLGHTYDLLLLEGVKILQWFNPFVWLLGRDLRAIHEYEADEAVINLGIDAKQYQQLLVTKAVGNRLQPFANNLRRGSLKKRILMMYRKKSSRPTMLKALFVVPVTALALCAFATPKVQEVVEAIDKADPTAPIVNKLITSEPSPAKPALSAGEPKGVLVQNVITADSISGIETDQVLLIVDGQVMNDEDFRELDSSTIDNVTVLKSESAAQVAKEHGLNPSDYKGAVIVNTKEYVASRVKDEIRKKVPANDGEIVVVSYSDNSSPVPNGDEIYISPEVEAQYPGGEAALMMQLAKTLRYPEYAQKNNLTGHVVLRFVVEKDGSIGPIKVQQSLEERCDAEAVLAVSKLKNFIPAQVGGAAVRSYVTLPVTFRLN